MRSENTEAALALAALVGITANNAGGEPADPINNSHLSESDQSSTDESGSEGAEGEGGENAPSGLFGEAEGYDTELFSGYKNKHQRKYRIDGQAIKLEGKEVKVGKNIDEIYWRVFGSEAITEKKMF